MPAPPKFIESNGWLATAAEIVRAGGVVALPYERLFGLAADAFNGSAIERVCQIKKRRTMNARIQPISVIASHRDEVGRVAASFPETAERLAKRHWPGPLTILVQGRKTLHPALVGPGGLVGVRVPGPSKAAELAAYTGLILTATSANRSGEMDALSNRDVVGLLGVDAVVEGEVAGPPGSTVVDCTATPPKTLRAGCVTIEGG